MEELKQCPFCGNNPHLIKQSYGLEDCYYFVRCESCGAEINNPKFSKSEAISDWNMRISQETDNAINIVRCKDCKYGQLINGEIWCHKYTPRTMIQS